MKTNALRILCYLKGPTITSSLSMCIWICRRFFQDNTRYHVNRSCNTRSACHVALEVHPTESIYTKSKVVLWKPYFVFTRLRRRPRDAVGGKWLNAPKRHCNTQTNHRAQSNKLDIKKKARSTYFNISTIYIYIYVGCNNTDWNRRFASWICISSSMVYCPCLKTLFINWSYDVVFSNWCQFTRESCPLHVV